MSTADSSSTSSGGDDGSATVDAAERPLRPRRRRRPMSLLRSITVASAATALAALSVASVAIATYTLSVQNQRARRDHLLPALDAVEDLYRALIDQDSAVRGYIITADPLFLTPYEHGIAAQADALGVLADSLLPEYAELYAVVTPVIDSARVWHDDIAQPEVDLVRSMRRTEAVTMVATGRGQRVFDELRAKVETLSSTIERERDVTRNALSRRIDALFVASLIGALVSLSMAFGLWLLVRRRVAEPLELLASQAATVAAGRLDTPIGAGGSIEIASVARSAEQMRVQLLGEIKAAFSTGMVLAESAERARLAGELHDDPIQVLTSAQWQLEALTVALEPSQQQAAQQVVRSLADVQSRLRTLMFRLHPPGLDDEGLAIALDDLLTDTFESTEVAIDLDVAEFGTGMSDAERALDSTTITLLFRIAAEAIRNVRKHAGASRIEVVVRGTGDGVHLSVTDDGTGSEADDLPVGPHGISISRALATAAGGWWLRSSRPAQGTVVTCWLPRATGQPTA